MNEKYCVKHMCMFGYIIETTFKKIIFDPRINQWLIESQFEGQILTWILKLHFKWNFGFSVKSHVESWGGVMDQMLWLDTESSVRSNFEFVNPIIYRFCISMLSPKVNIKIEYRIGCKGQILNRYWDQLLICMLVSRLDFDLSVESKIRIQGQILVPVPSSELSLDSDIESSIEIQNPTLMIDLKFDLNIRSETHY